MGRDLTLNFLIATSVSEPEHSRHSVNGNPLPLLPSQALKGIDYFFKCPVSPSDVSLGWVYTVDL